MLPDCDPPDLGNEDPEWIALLQQARWNVADAEAAEAAA